MLCEAAKMMNGYKNSRFDRTWRDLYVYQAELCIRAHEDQYKLLNAQLISVPFRVAKTRPPQIHFKRRQFKPPALTYVCEKQNAWRLLEQFSQNGSLEARGHRTVLPGAADELVSDIYIQTAMYGKRPIHCSS